MKAREIQYAIIKEVEGHSEFAKMTSDDVFYWFNKAQEKFVSTRYSTNNIYNVGFEETQKRIDDLRTLVTVAKETTSTEVALNTSTKTISINLPTDYLHLLRLEITAHLPGCPSSVVLPIQVQHDDLNKLLKDPFNRPSLQRPLYCIVGSTVEVYLPSNALVDEVIFTYLKKPRYVTINNPDTEKQFQDNLYTNEPDLPLGTHREIVDIAVAMMLGSLGDQRVNLKMAELQTNE